MDRLIKVFLSLLAIPSACMDRLIKVFLSLLYFYFVLKEQNKKISDFRFFLKEKIHHLKEVPHAGLEP